MLLSKKNLIASLSIIKISMGYHDNLSDISSSDESDEE